MLGQLETWLLLLYCFPCRVSLAKDRCSPQSRANQREQAEQPLLPLRRDRDRSCASYRWWHHHADIRWAAVWLRGEKKASLFKKKKKKKTPLNLDLLSPSFLWWQVLQGTISSWSWSLKSFREITVSFSTDCLLNVFDVWRMMTGLELMLSMPTYLPGPT